MADWLHKGASAAGFRPLEQVFWSLGDVRRPSRPLGAMSCPCGEGSSVV